MIVLAVGLALSLWLSANVGRFHREVRESAASIAPQIVRDIATDWDPGRLERWASPKLLSEMPTTERTKAFDALRQRYGRLTSIGAVTAQDPVVLQDEGKALVTVMTRVTGSFERGRATIQTILVRDVHSWRVASLFVDDGR